MNWTPTFNGQFFQNEVYIILNLSEKNICRAKFRSESCLEQHKTREFGCSKIYSLIWRGELILEQLGKIREWWLPNTLWLSQYSSATAIFSASTGSAYALQPAISKEHSRSQLGHKSACIMAEGQNNSPIRRNLYLWTRVYHLPGAVNPCSNRFLPCSPAL